MPAEAGKSLKLNEPTLSRCRSAGIDDGLVRSNRHPAVVGLPDFSVLPAFAVDLHPVDGRHLAAADRVSILPFSVCSFESSSYTSPEEQTHSWAVKFPVKLESPTLGGCHRSALNRPISDGWTLPLLALSGHLGTRGGVGDE